MTVSGTDIVIFGDRSDRFELGYPIADPELWVYILDTSKVDFDQQQPDNLARIRALNQSEDGIQARHSIRYRDSVSVASEFTNDTSKMDFDQQQSDNSVQIRALNQSEDGIQAWHSIRYRDSVSIASEFTNDTSKMDFDQQQSDNSVQIRALNQSEDGIQAWHSIRYRDSVSVATEFTNLSEVKYSGIRIGLVTLLNGIIVKSQMVTTSLQLDLYFAKPNQYRQTSREARLDTQADGNFMSETLVDFLGHEVSPYTSGRFNTASGDVIPMGEVSVIFQWQESAKMRKKRFLVLPDTGNLPYDIILGINFISEFEVYLFNNSLLVLALANMTPSKALLIVIE